MGQSDSFSWLGLFVEVSGFLGQNLLFYSVSTLYFKASSIPVSVPILSYFFKDINDNLFQTITTLLISLLKAISSTEYLVL